MRIFYSFSFIKNLRFKTTLFLYYLFHLLINYVILVLRNVKYYFNTKYSNSYYVK